MIGNSPFGQMEKEADLDTARRIMEIAGAATNEEAVANAGGELTFYQLQYKLEKEGRISIRPIIPTEICIIDSLDLLLEERDVKLALKILHEVRETFSRYDEYMELVGVLVK